MDGEGGGGLMYVWVTVVYKRARIRERATEVMAPRLGIPEPSESRA